MLTCFFLIQNNQYNLNNQLLIQVLIRVKVHTNDTQWQNDALSVRNENMVDL